MIEARSPRTRGENSKGADLFALLACPLCRGNLHAVGAGAQADKLACADCGATYPLRDGIPILLPPGFDTTGVHDEIEHNHGAVSHKQGQADYFDRDVAAEWETRRPHGAPEAYRWLLAEKFRRGIAGLPPLSGATVVDACCGSGMDAEMLVNAGARVIAVDISEGCARRAKRRAERYGLDYLVVVGDVEHLPLRDRAVDIGYVHDGLHHLAAPSTGVRELTRVAKRAVSINEPAEALATALAIRLGLALATEDAGNRVARLRRDDVRRVLEAAGFDSRMERYLMYYKHHPGALMRVASRPFARGAYRAAVSAANTAFGHWGNKLNITAHRKAPDRTVDGGRLPALRPQNTRCASETGHVGRQSHGDKGEP